jgi:hypothetical protein
LDQDSVLRSRSASISRRPQTSSSTCYARIKSLRISFPRALSEGASGAFCQRLCSSEALMRYGLPEAAQTTLPAAFEAKLGARVRRVYEQWADLRRTYLLAYLPSGRALFFAG